MNKRVVILLHVAVWVLMFITPLTYMRGYGFSLLRYLMMCASPVLPELPLADAALFREG